MIYPTPKSFKNLASKYQTYFFGYIYLSVLDPRLTTNFADPNFCCRAPNSLNHRSLTLAACHGQRVNGDPDTKALPRGGKCWQLWRSGGTLRKIPIVFDVPVSVGIHNLLISVGQMWVSLHPHFEGLKPACFMFCLFFSRFWGPKVVRIWNSLFIFDPQCFDMGNVW